MRDQFVQHGPRLVQNKKKINGEWVVVGHICPAYVEKLKPKGWKKRRLKKKLGRRTRVEQIMRAKQ